MPFDLSKLDTRNLTHLTLVGDNATNIEHIEHYHAPGASPQAAGAAAAAAKPFDGAYALLDTLIAGLQAMGRNEARDLLLPYMAAVQSHKLPALRCEEFNRRYHTDFSAKLFSKWAGVSTPYCDAELEPYLRLFEELGERPDAK